MKQCQMVGWTLLVLVAGNAIIPALAYPSIHQAALEAQQQQAQDQYHQARKFAEKPNATKKVAILENRNDFDDLTSNQITDGGFSWSNMIGMVMQLLFPTTPHHSGPSKSDGLDDTGLAPSPWAQILTVGLRIVTALLGGGTVASDGAIDKVDTSSSPMQGVLAAVLSGLLGSRDPDQVSTMAKQAGEFINIVVNLLDALKTSFSHRSLTARSLGKKDSLSEAAVASLTIFKGYMRTLKTSDETCALRYMCEANQECTGDMSASNSIYCQLGSYAASFMLKGGLTPFDAYYDAGRRGRAGDDCQQVYLTCNTV